MRGQNQVSCRRKIVGSIKVHRVNSTTFGATRVTPRMGWGRMFEPICQVKGGQGYRFSNWLNHHPHSGLPIYTSVATEPPMIDQPTENITPHICCTLAKDEEIVKLIKHPQNPLSISCFPLVDMVFFWSFAAPRKILPHLAGNNTVGVTIQYGEVRAGESFSFLPVQGFGGTPSSSKV